MQALMLIDLFTHLTPSGRSKNVDAANPTVTSEGNCEFAVQDSCDTVWALSRRGRLKCSVEYTTVAASVTTIDGVVTTSDLSK